MKRTKIINKFFGMISLALASLLVIQLVFQSFYLQKFYIDNKIRGITKNLESLAKQIKKLSKEEIENELLKFSQEQGAAIGLMDIYGNPVYGMETQRSFVTLEDKQGEIYKVYIETFINMGLEENDLNIGESIQVVGMQTQSGNVKIIQPYSMNIRGKVYNITSLQKSTVSASTTYTTLENQMISPDVNPLPKEKSIDANELLEAKKVEIIPDIGEDNMTTSMPTQYIVKQIEGIIKQIYMPNEKVYGNGYRENKLLQEVSYFLSSMILEEKKLVEGKPIIYKELDQFVGMTNVVGIVPMILDKEPMFLSAMISLQQVEEAVSIMSQYSAISFILVFLIALGIAYFYAKRITKPLVDLRNITTQIANLDFTTKCRVESKDEIGDLAENINTMSEQLEASVEALRRDMALKDRLDKQRKQFIADVSHELKTPLTVLQGTCYGIRDGLYQLEDDICLESIEEQINIMSELVKELLEVARLEKEIELKEEGFDLAHIVLKVNRELKYLAQEKEIHVKLELKESIVRGDRKKIETVMRNLYNNAIFYTPAHQQVLIKIEGSTLSVENEGVTISEEIIPRLWEPFYRADQSRNKSLGGSGLGLYMVKQILDKHEASYQITSTGHSVKVEFTLKPYMDKNNEFF